MIENDRDVVADEEARTPLSEREASVMGAQRPRPLQGIDEADETIYGEVDGPETEDQFDAHHADEDEHL